jgi:hypothetical protein
VELTCLLDEIVEEIAYDCNAVSTALEASSSLGVKQIVTINILISCDDAWTGLLREKCVYIYIGGLPLSPTGYIAHFLCHLIITPFSPLLAKKDSN